MKKEIILNVTLSDGKKYEFVLSEFVDFLKNYHFFGADRIKKSDIMGDRVPEFFYVSFLEFQGRDIPTIEKSEFLPKVLKKIKSTKLIDIIDLDNESGIIGKNF